MRTWEKMRRGLCSLLAAALLLTSFITTALAATYPFTGKINDDTNMRSAPKSSVANVIRRILEGETVKVTGASGNFYRIEFDGRTGYVFKQYVNKVADGYSESTGSNTGSSNTGDTAVTTAAVNLRNTATSSGKIILTIAKGERVQVNLVEESWVNVTYATKTGWVSKQYVDLSGLSTPESGPTAGTDMGQSGYVLLQSGANNTHVIALQEALIELGYLRGEADGEYGSATSQAVMALQKANGYPINGVADANLQAFIFNGKPLDVKGKETAVKTVPAIEGINVRYGDKGVVVRTIQSRLETLGYLTDNVTGTYDQETEAAVKAFQTAKGLKADGVCGDDTRTALMQGVNVGGSSQPTPTPTPTPMPTFQGPTATVKKGSKGNNAVLVQQRLIELGYLDGAADGKFGAQSVAALKAFQTKNSLKVDGVAGSGTYEILFSVMALAADYSPYDTPSDLPNANATPAPTYPPITRENVVLIRQGVKGDEVLNLQTRLTQLGYYQSNKDGVCKTDDVAAIRAFQRMNGLAVDGIAGYDTQSLMYSNVAIMDNGQMFGGTQTNYLTLQKGMSGPQVLELQNRLISLGYMTGTASGVYNTDTAEAVYNFQQRNGLVRDGIAGEKTLRILYSTTAILPSAPPAATTPPMTLDTLLRKGDESDLVIDLQTRLIKLGYLTGTADGIFGARTYQAVKNFQRANALYADGIVGNQTFAALNLLTAGNNGSNTGDGANTAPTVTDSPSTSVGTTVAVRAENVIYEYWYSTVRNACRKYPYATVYDYQTGISWQVHMFSYGKHAEAEPLTAADTAKMEEACGGNVWTPRPVWVIFADGTIRIATTHSVPHEVEHIKDNDFPGHTCIHFPRTMAQVTSIGPYATRHQNAVDKAWAQTQAMAK